MPRQKIEYNQVLVVDADSMVHPDCPNFFEMTDNKFTSVLTDGDFEWVNRAINGYSKMFFEFVNYVYVKPDKPGNSDSVSKPDDSIRILADIHKVTGHVNCKHPKRESSEDQT